MCNAEQRKKMRETLFKYNTEMAVEKKDMKTLRMLQDAGIITFVLKRDGVYAKPSPLGKGLKSLAGGK